MNLGYLFVLQTLTGNRILCDMVVFGMLPYFFFFCVLPLIHQRVFPVVVRLSTENGFDRFDALGSLGILGNLIFIPTSHTDT